MKTLAQLLKILIPSVFLTSAVYANSGDLYKTEKEVQAAENKKKKIKEVPQLPVAAPAAKPGPEVNCTTDTGETLGPKDKGLEQCLIDSKKPTKVKGK